MNSSERNLSPNMPQYPTDSRSNMRSSRVELQRSEGSSSYPREQQVHTQTQSLLSWSADYSSVRQNSLFRLIARATRQEIKARREDPVRRTLRPSRQGPGVPRDRLARHTLRARPPGAVFWIDILSRPTLRPVPQKARV